MKLQKTSDWETGQTCWLQRKCFDYHISSRQELLCSGAWSPRKCAAAPGKRSVNCVVELWNDWEGL